MNSVNLVIRGLIAVLVLGALTAPFLLFIQNLNLPVEQQGLASVVAMTALVWGAVRIIE